MKISSNVVYYGTFDHININHEKSTYIFLANPALQEMDIPRFGY